MTLLRHVIRDNPLIFADSILQGGGCARARARVRVYIYRADSKLTHGDA